MSQRLSSSKIVAFLDIYQKLLLRLRALLIVSFVLSGPVLQPSDVFEQPLPAGQKKIEFHISVPEVAAVVEQSGLDQREDEGRGQCDGHNADFLTGP